MPNIFFTSDLHFGHKNIIRFDNRPFTTIEEMDKALIRNWNNKVNDDDTVYVLGDISWYKDDKTTEIFSLLKGHKILIKGNHDRVHGKIKNCFDEIVDYKEIQISKDCGIVLSHYPIPCFNNHYYGWYHLYGHVHKSFEWNMMENVKFQMSALYDKECRMYNVGIMIPYMEFMPKTLEEIVEAEKIYSALRGIVNV